MKKLMVFAFALGLLTPAVGFAADLNDISGIELSNQVSGAYFVDDTTDRTAYQLTTAHTQGDRAFASGSDETEIYYQENDDPTSLLISAYSAGAFSSGTTWTPVGDEKASN